MNRTIYTVASGGMASLERLDLARLRSEVGDVNTVSAERVSGLSAVMAKGQYSADVRDVSAKVLRSILGELLS